MEMGLQRLQTMKILDRQGRTRNLFRFFEVTKVLQKVLQDNCVTSFVTPCNTSEVTREALIIKGLNHV